MVHTIIGVAVLLVFLPETSGKSMDEIAKKYSHGWRNSLFMATASKKDSSVIESHIQNLSNQPDQSYQNEENSNV